MKRLPIGIVGASGYSGLEATRLLASHPFADLCFASSDRWKGESLAARAGVSGDAAKLSYAPLEDSERLAAECAAVLLATPVEVSLELAPKLVLKGVRVIDFSGAFRLRDPAAFKKAYGLTHPAPDLALQSVYGLPEQHRAHIRGATLLANPGCYATAAALAFLPLVRARLVEGPLICDAASGVTGAGRKATEEFSFGEIDGDFRAYRVFRHQHLPEIAQTLGVPLTFTAHLLPLRRGILATCYARLAPKVDAGAPQAELARAYANEPFVRVLSEPDAVGLKDVVGTNRCAVAAASDGATVIAISALDNLVKGAAGQAVQNLNLMLGWPETAGLDAARPFRP